MVLALCGIMAMPSYTYAGENTSVSDKSVITVEKETDISAEQTDTETAETEQTDTAAETETAQTENSEAAETKSAEMETETESETETETESESETEDTEKNGLYKEYDGIYYYENGERFIDGLKEVQDEDGVNHTYYFQKDGRAYTKGLLELKDGDTSSLRYFQSNGQMYTEGYISTGTYAVLDQEGNVVNKADGVKRYYYFQTDGKPYTKGLLEFTNSYGTYEFYFQKNGEGYTDGYLSTSTYAVADKNGKITNKADGVKRYYYFQKNGRAYTKGLLKFSNDKGTHFFYFLKNGQGKTDGYISTGTYAVVDDKGNIVNKADGKTRYYYFQKNGQAFKKGLLKFTNSKGTHFFYFQKNGEGFTGGYKPTATYFVADDKGNITDKADGKTRYYYFQTNGQAYKKGLLQFTNSKGTFYFYFQKNGEAYTGGLKSTGTYAVADKKGKITDKADKKTRKYYFQSNGQAYTKGYKTINDKKYYFNTNGQMVTGWKKIDKNWCYFDLKSGVKKFESNTLHSAWKKAQDISSQTDWLILVDDDETQTMIFKGSKGNWVPVYNWNCSTGASSTPTVHGFFKVQAKGYSFGNGYTCYYYTQFYGDYLFHSVLYHEGTFNVRNGRLGAHISHGCIRLKIDKAKWIYDNIPRGTKVYIY